MNFKLEFFKKSLLSRLFSANFFNAIFTIFFLTCFSSIRCQSIQRLLKIDKDFELVVHFFGDTASSTWFTGNNLVNQLNTANQKFDSIGIHFTICQILFHENTKYRSFSVNPDKAEVINLFHQKNRINVYIVEEILQGPNYCNYADFLGISDVSNTLIILQTADGCVSPATMSLTQALGVYFGLYRTHENVGELADGSNCATAGDQICDTPADPFSFNFPITDFIDANCEFIFLQTDANGDYYVPHVQNIMSNYPCRCDFTRQQFMKMANNYLLNQGAW